MISNELLEEVISISKNKQFISRGLLLRIVVNVIEKSNEITKSKFQGFECGDLGWDFAIATCNKENGIISLNYDEALKNEKEAKIFSYLKANLNIISHVLHEIEHLNEFYKIAKNNFESKIIKISTSEFISLKCLKMGSTLFLFEEQIYDFQNKKFRQFYEKYWNIIPSEKIAELDSYKNILRSLYQYPNFCDEHPKVYEHILQRYLNALKLGYNCCGEKQNYNIPLTDYLGALKTINYKMNLENLNVSLKSKDNISSDLKLEKRMRFGLPVTKEEVEELDINKILIKSTK